MDFDYVINSKFKENIVIDYGIISGNNKILFIKSGQDGSVYGYNNKYLKIAKKVNEKYGYTVICSSNPFDGDNPLDNAFEVIKNYCKENSFDDYEIYYMGHSNGALIGLWFGTNYDKITKFLLINGPLMFNWHRTKEVIKNFNKKKLCLVYGEYDQSIKYTELISPLINEKVELKIIENEDHHFSNNFEDYINLPLKFLFNDEE